jgi:hypothetical protein
MPFTDFFVATENELVQPQLRVFERGQNRAGPVVFQVPWEDYPASVRHYLGYATVQDGIIVRHLPVRHPKHRDMIAVRAEVRNVTQVGLDESLSITQDPLTTMNKSEFVFVSLYFESVLYDLGEFAGDTADPMRGLQPGSEVRRYAIKKVLPARELVTAAKGTYAWAEADGSPSATKQVQVDIATVLGYDEVRVALIDWPYDAIPFTALNDCRDAVNESILELPSRPPPTHYDPETVQFVAYDLTDVFFPTGDLTPDTRGATLTYFFRHREQGWNREPAPDGSFRLVFRKVSVGKSSSEWKKKYAVKDLSRLFRPEGA